MAGKLRFIDFLRLCLVPIKYEGKCKGKKIQRKSRKKNVKENDFFMFGCPIKNIKENQI